MQPGVQNSNLLKICNLIRFAGVSPATHVEKRGRMGPRLASHQAITASGRRMIFFRMA